MTRRYPLYHQQSARPSHSPDHTTNGWGIFAKLRALSKMCVFMYVGEFDPYRWHGEMQWEVEYLRSQGTLARYTVEKDQPHRLDTLAGANAGRLFDGFEETKKGCQLQPSRY